MKIAYFDTIAGISGDMTLGAFISAGFPLDDLQNEIQKSRGNYLNLFIGNTYILYFIGYLMAD